MNKQLIQENEHIRSEMQRIKQRLQRKLSADARGMLRYISVIEQDFAEYSYNQKY